MIVHFPIALFFLYGAIEVLGLDRKWNELKWVKRFLLIFSFLFSLLALWSGDMTDHSGFRNDSQLRQIFQMHQTMAQAFAWVSGILSAGVLAQIAREKIAVLPVWANSLVSFLSFFAKRWVSFVLALVGLALITATVV